MANQPTRAAIVMMSRKLSLLVEKGRLGRRLLQVTLTRATLPIPSRGAFATRIISDLWRGSRASPVAAHLPIPIICALRKAAHLDGRSATSGSSHSAEAIIARFIATVTNAAGGKESGLTPTLPHK